jgi:hypothetical protein
MNQHMKTRRMVKAALLLVIISLCLFIWGMPRQAATSETAASALLPAPPNDGRLIHVLVALCDNEFQGIVPVPAKIGNGDDPSSNLYWGAAYGVKTYFRKAKQWKLVQITAKLNEHVLERLVFKHTSRDVWLVADAYRGREIERCTHDFLRFAAGREASQIDVQSGSDNQTLHVGGSADLVVYIGHDGLMDFSLPDYPAKSDERERDAIILACASKPYFTEPLRRTGARPLLWTTGLMAPEAYTLKAALDGWIGGEDGAKVHERAAQAYHTYQKCGVRSARKLFATGW